jgi:DNA-directed RNA polymerase specialized sigma24 family protein
MADEFLTTRWSIVLAAGRDDSSAGKALERLCRDVWRPLYAFARRWGCSPQDAEDAVQGFIESLLARHSLEKVGPGRGKFRSFLLAGMRNHLSDAQSRATAAKRGGKLEHLSLDQMEEGYESLAVEEETPEKVFERVWAMEIMSTSRQKLADECEASGKGVLFASVFAENAAPSGLSDTAFRSAAMRLRRRWQELIREALAQTVSSREALDEEMECLRAALRQ